MRRHSYRFILLIEMPDIASHSVGHSHKTIHTANKIARKKFVEHSRFVRNHIVYQRYHFCAWRAGKPRNSSETGRHKCHPVTKDYPVGQHFFNFAPHSHPVQRIHRINPSANTQIRRSFFVGKLRLSGKEKRRILKRKSEYLHLMTFLYKLVRQPLIVSSQSATIWMRSTDNDYLHFIDIFVHKSCF